MIFIAMAHRTGHPYGADFRGEFFPGGDTDDTPHHFGCLDAPDVLASGSHIRGAASFYADFTWREDFRYA